MTPVESPLERYERVAAEREARHEYVMDQVRDAHRPGPVRVADRAVGMPPRDRKDQT